MGKNKERETEFEKMASDVAGKHSKRMNAMLLTMTDEDFMVAYFKILEYAKPKLQRQDLNVDVSVDNIVIQRVDIPVDEIEKD